MEHLGYILALHSENGLEINTAQTSADTNANAKQIECDIDNIIAGLQCDGYEAFHISKEELKSIIEMLQEAYND